MAVNCEVECIEALPVGECWICSVQYENVGYVCIATSVAEPGHNTNSEYKTSSAIISTLLTLTRIAQDSPAPPVQRSRQ